MMYLTVVRFVKQLPSKSYQQNLRNDYSREKNTQEKRAAEVYAPKLYIHNKYIKK